MDETNIHEAFFCLRYKYMAIFIGVKLLVIKLMSHGEHKIQSRDIPHTFQLIYRKDILYIKV